jgi:hypothetical protein
MKNVSIIKTTNAVTVVAIIPPLIPRIGIVKISNKIFVKNPTITAIMVDLNIS